MEEIDDVAFNLTVCPLIFVEESSWVTISGCLSVLVFCSAALAPVACPRKKAVPTKTDVTPTLSFLIVYLETLLADFRKYRSRLFLETIV